MPRGRETNNCGLPENEGKRRAWAAGTGRGHRQPIEAARKSGRAGSSASQRSPEIRHEAAIKANQARTPEERSEIARKAAEARWSKQA